MMRVEQQQNPVSEAISSENKYRITGVLLDYYFICKRKLWLFAKQLNMENISGNANVIQGKLLHENRFKRESRREVMFEEGVFDFIKVKGEIIVHEVKKSKAFEEAHTWQLKYYIYLLRQKGVNCSGGVLHYPTSMRKVDVEYQQEDDMFIEDTIKGIVSILDSAKPPSRLARKSCSKCAYFDFCYV